MEIKEFGLALPYDPRFPNSDSWPERPGEGPTLISLALV
jgi:hypothetical protein